MDISTSGAPLEARFQLDAADYKAFQALAKAGKPFIGKRQLASALAALFVLIFVASLLFHRMLASQPAASPGNTTIGPTLDTIFLLFIPLGAFLMFSGWLLRLYSNKVSLRNIMFTEPTLVTLDESALTRQCGAFFSRAQWRGITRVIASDAHLILMISPNEGFIVPRRAFDDDASWQRFADFAQQQWQRAQPAAPPIANV